MDIQSVGSNSIPSGSAADGARVAVPAPSASSTHPVAAQKPVVEAKPNAATLQKAVETINQSLKQHDTNLNFSIDKDTKMDVVKLLDTNTGEVIRQYPSEVTLAIAKAIDQGMKPGALFNQTA